MGLYDANAISRLREILGQEDASAMIVPSSDPHFGEYVPDHYKCIEWLCGFTGEAGTLVVTMDRAALWTDSRFFIQAAAELDGTGVELMRQNVPGTPSLAQWLKDNLAEDDIVVMDEDLFSYSDYTAMVDALAPVTPSLVEDPFDRIWKDRPALVFNPVRHIGVEISGETSMSKYERLCRTLAMPVPFAYIMTAMDDIAWLCNLRGTDVDYNALPMAYAVVDNRGIALFARQAMLSEEAVAALTSDGLTELREYEEFGRYLQTLPKDCVRIFASGKVTAKYFFAAMDNVYNNPSIPSHVPDPVTGGTVAMMKAVKNEVEADGFRKACVVDGRAISRVIAWVRENAGTGITEKDVALKIEEYRKESADYLGESFPSIVAYGANAALPHYSIPESGGAEIGRDGLLLIDTGAHYAYGTTDTTRMIPLGNLTQEEKDDYTAVLKGLIRLSMAVFPQGTRGCLLDILARGEVYRRGKRYLHGTSHGIGHVLCVHEGPQSIRMEENPVALADGMVLSVEPGVYVEGSHGIRHENTVIVTPCTDAGSEGFSRFETITRVPIDLSPVNASMLDDSEKEWIESFNRCCSL